MRLRPHHILCLRFLALEPPDRGNEFERISREIREILISHEDALIEVTCGVDHLCGYCPYLGEGRCISPFGEEDKVRRWDARVVEGLGLEYGDRKTAGELRRIISDNAPLAFCRERCPWKTICKVFEL
ncbi:MAG TPA: DUF1284 domain-containing protein, partial [Desulfomonilia bacterium]|nr:DUF1284 domain-containing protein [Desulfomonilia bacterium]